MPAIQADIGMASLDLSTRNRKTAGALKRGNQVLHSSNNGDFL